MNKVLQIALGIIAAIGGFVDIGDLVFNIQAGSRFGYQLLWAIPVGVIGIMVFAEMSGRVAAIHKKANFELVRERYSARLGLATLIASLVLCFDGLPVSADQYSGMMRRLAGAVQTAARAERECRPNG